jgi:hypothetical protein
VSPPHADAASGPPLQNVTAAKIATGFFVDTCNVIVPPTATACACMDVSDAELLGQRRAGGWQGVLPTGTAEGGAAARGTAAGGEALGGPTVPGAGLRRVPTGRAPHQRWGAR